MKNTVFAFAAQRTEFPDDPILKFENIHKQVEAPFTVYADFESILKQLSGDGKQLSVKNISLVLTLRCTLRCTTGIFNHMLDQKDSPSDAI